MNGLASGAAVPRTPRRSQARGSTAATRERDAVADHRWEEAL
ncbi:hypothetical protein [Nocardia coffeae]|nr:hypothetical protein [Nocardia coffeae]